MSRAWICVFLLAVATYSHGQPVSLDDVKVDFGAGNYRAALTKTNRLFTASLQEPPPAQKYELLMLRGECQIQLKDRLGAIASFKSAAKCASDVNQLSVAKANALIIERSSMGKYTPRLGASKDAIDILPMES